MRRTAHYFHYPTINSFGYATVDTNEENERFTLIDECYREKFDALMKISKLDDNKSPSIAFTKDFLAKYADHKILGPTKTKEKAQLKEIIVSLFADKEIPEGHSVVPLNYQAYDVRLENLVIVPGTGKNFKTPTRLEVPAEYAPDYSPTYTDGGRGPVMMYLPRGLSISTSTNHGVLAHSFIIGKSKKTSNTVNFIKTLDEKINFLREADKKTFDANHEKYQRLLTDFFAAKNAAMKM